MDSLSLAPVTPSITATPPQECQVPSGASEVRGDPVEPMIGAASAHAAASDTLRELEPILVDRLPGARSQMAPSSYF